MNNPYIVGKRVYLRSLEREDLKKGYRGWLNDSETNRYLASGIFPTSSKELEDYYEKVTSSKTDVMFAICLKKTDKYIGNAKIGGIDWVARRAFPGRLIGDKKYRGKGYGTEVMYLLLKYAFETLNLNRIYNVVLIENEASVKSCERLGFAKEGRFREFTYREGRYIDAVQLAMTQKTYFRLKSKGIFERALKGKR